MEGATPPPCHNGAPVGPLPCTARRRPQPPSIALRRDDVGAFALHEHVPHRLHPFSPGCPARLPANGRRYEGDDQPAAQPGLIRAIGAQQFGDRLPRRLLRDHVEAGTGQVAVAQAAFQRIDVEDRAARVYHRRRGASAWPQAASSTSSRVCRVSGQWMERYRIAPAAPPASGRGRCRGRGPSHWAGRDRRTPPCSRRPWPAAPPPSRWRPRPMMPKVCTSFRRRTMAKGITAQGAGAGPRWLSLIQGQAAAQRDGQQPRFRHLLRAVVGQVGDEDVARRRRRGPPGHNRHPCGPRPSALGSGRAARPTPPCAGSSAHPPRRAGCPAAPPGWIWRCPAGCRTSGPRIACSIAVSE